MEQIFDFLNEKRRKDIEQTATKKAIKRFLFKIDEKTDESA